jgi:prepilin-type N-terminal cleavage/methylation domain-containing protein
LNKKGFTLIEILVAGALFIVIIGGFNYLLKAAGAQSRAAQKLSLALNLARGEMEKLRSRPGTAELEAIEVTVRWDARKPPVHLISLRSGD